MSGTVTVFGLNAVGQALSRHPERVRELVVAAGRDDARIAELVALAEAGGVAVQRQPREGLDRQAGGGAHQGVLARMRPAPNLDQDGLMELLDGLSVARAQPLLLVLDQVTDPHNLGACLRTADAAGAHAVVVPKDRSAALTPAARKVASGAAETMPLARVTNLARCLRALAERGVWRVGLAGEGSISLHQAHLDGSLALVMGAEDKGLRRLTREHCDEIAAIPMGGSVESLNVSVAAGVALFEAVRQRGV